MQTCVVPYVEKKIVSENGTGSKFPAPFGNEREKEREKVLSLNSFRDVNIDSSLCGALVDGRRA